MTRRQKRRNFSEWLADCLGRPSGEVNTKRRILVEPLESRQLLAGDLFTALLGSNDGGLPANDHLTGTTGLVGEGEMSAEGEDADDLVALARAISDSGTRFFGAAWCQFCTDQKELFEDGADFLPFIEVTNPDRTPNSIASSEGITEYPTWEFPDGSRLTGVQSIQTIAQRSNITTIPQSSTPSLRDLPDVNVGIGSPLHIPIDAYDPNGNPLTVTVQSSDPSLVTGEVISGNRSLRITTAGFGDMTFELFETRAPRPAGRVIELANNDFYDGIIFHRVIDNFVIQGGDPTGTGSGGSTLGDFDDQFHVDLQHNANGILSYAKAGDDTNDSQFFITEGPTRHLDFNHSVFGIMTEGESVREAISNTAVGAGDRPVNDVVIEDATVFTDTENSVIMLRPTGNGTGSATITVTVTDNEGLSSSKTFTANVGADTENGSPFLNDIPDVQTSVDTPVNIDLTFQDKEGDSAVFAVQPVGSTNFDVQVDSNGRVTATPPSGFVGQLQFRATVSQSGVSGSDSQVVNIDVTATTPTAVDLVASSDSGSSSSDDITAESVLVFSVTGTTPGATVDIVVGSTVVGTATATGTTTEVTVSNAASLGQGSTLFSARQTSGGQTSPTSPALAVTLDSVAPATVDASAFPASVIVDTPISVNLDHSEEGQGLTYEIISGPTAAQIGQSDGVFSWTPSNSDLGANSITLRMTDLAGNSIDQVVSINVIEAPLVQFSLNPIDASGTPLTSVEVGQEFRVQVIASDLRTGDDADGVFAAYLDLLYDQNIIEPVATNPINHVAPYTNAATGGLDTPGLIDELGGFSSDTGELGSDPRVIAEVTFVARAVGNPNLRTEAADLDPQSQVLLFTRSPAVPTTQIDYQRATLAVGANFTTTDDSFNFDEDSSQQSLNVLNNDTISTGDSLTITGVSTASGGGTVSIASGGTTLNYTPAADFTGAETFTYTVENQAGIEGTATVTVQITDINDPPVALNDTFSVDRNSTLNVLEVLANDSSGVDPSGGESLSVTAVGTGSAGGTITLGPSGLTLRYTPASDFTGTETFTYTLSDGRGGTSQGTVTVNVEVVNPPPTPQNDSFTVTEDAAEASFDVLANDSTDDPNETLEVSAVQQPSLGGIATVAADGQSILYRPGPNFTGTEIFAYTLRDSGGATSQGLVTFTVTPVNDAPDAINDSFNLVSSADNSELNVLVNDVNVDSGETLTITGVSTPPDGNGTLTISSSGDRLLYTSPNSTFEGTFTATYTIDDGTGLEDTATVTITVSNFVPRSISGNFLVSSQPRDPGSAFYGSVVELVGTDMDGNAVNSSIQVGADGQFAFNDLAPGNYTLRRPPMPFLHDEGQEIPITSGVSDGDFSADLMVSGGLRPEFFDVRDFLSSTARGNLGAALGSDGAQAWTAARGDWADFSNVEVNMEGDNQLRIQATNAQSEVVEATLPLGSNLITHRRGQEAGNQLIHVRAAAADISFTPVVDSQDSGSGEGESNPQVTGGLVGEGEATPPIPTIESVRVAAPPVSEQPSSLQSDAGRSDSGQPEVLANDTLRRMLSSARTQTDVLAASNVDAALEDALPEMQLRLADDLESDLTDDPEDSAIAGDQLFGQL
ncbi:MAG TPA: peptidylprolyl isomerase [Planctomycetaceae bacterium]|nr:peptidylprolyl isomerase [Planctomycetaceae bacterium]